MAFGVDRIEGQRRLPGPTEAGDDDERPPWKVQVNVFQIMGARPPNDEMLAQGSSSPHWHASRRRSNCHHHGSSRLSLPRLNPFRSPQCGGVSAIYSLAREV